MSGSVNNAELEAFLANLQARGNAVRAILPIIGQDLKAAVEDVYAAEGPGWPPLKGETLAARRKGKSSIRIIIGEDGGWKKAPKGSKKGRKAPASHKILQDSGIMAASTDVKVGDNWVEAFAGVSYAEYHARGEGVPVRNPFDLGPFEDGVLADAADLVAGAVAQ